jgi:uncharacterized protein (DUF697 family)
MVFPIWQDRQAPKSLPLLRLRHRLFLNDPEAPFTDGIFKRDPLRLTLMNQAEFEQQREALIKEAPIPRLWMLGKTGSGKTSIIRYLTGATRAEIGNGFKPQTKFSQQYDFPDDDVPLVQFLDTRGLGEAGYDPTLDLNAFQGNAHLLIVTVRLTDQATDALTAPLTKIRAANPSRPVLLTLTCLHDAYDHDEDNLQHPTPDPFDTLTHADFRQPTLSQSQQQHFDTAHAPDFTRLLMEKFKKFEGLFDYWTAIDLTKPDEGFDQTEFGGQRLKSAIIELLPEAYRQAIVQIDDLNQLLTEAQKSRAAPVIMAHSLLAASAAVVPVPWVDIPLVLGIQSRLAYKLAEMNGQKLDTQTISTVSASLGGRVAMRMGIRGTLKFIPWVGSAVNSAATFAITYASGWAWNWYFMKISQGHIPTADELKEVYAQQLTRGESLWKRSKENESN